MQSKEREACGVGVWRIVGSCEKLPRRAAMMKRARGGVDRTAIGRRPGESKHTKGVLLVRLAFAVSSHVPARSMRRRVASFSGAAIGPERADHVRRRREIVEIERRPRGARPAQRLLRYCWRRRCRRAMPFGLLLGLDVANLGADARIGGVPVNIRGEEFEHQRIDASAARD